KILPLPLAGFFSLPRLRGRVRVGPYHYPFWLAALQHRPDRQGGLADDFAFGCRAVPGGVRRDYQARMRWNRMFARWRLDRENVDRGTGQLATLKHRQESVQVDERATRCVDEVRPARHQR